MIHARICPVFVPVFAAAFILAGPWTAQAQPGGGARPEQTPKVLQEIERRVPVAPEGSAEQVRREFYEVMDQYPPGLGRVLRLDPSLLQNQAYLASYPELTAYLAQHPQITHNPGYYLERYGSNEAFGVQLDPQRQAVAVWRQIIDFMGAFLVFVAIASIVIYLFRYLVEYRRWHRVARIQTDVHNKILDRFASNEDLLAYIQTPAGRRFLESSPIVLDSGPRSVGAPFTRILWSVQIGVVVAVAAIGLMFVSSRAVPEVSGAIFAVASIGMALGIGFVLSAAVAYTLSRRMGLIEPPATPPAPHTPGPV